MALCASAVPAGRALDGTRQTLAALDKKRRQPLRFLIDPRHIHRQRLSSLEGVNAANGQRISVDKRTASSVTLRSSHEQPYDREHFSANIDFRRQ